MGKAREAVLVAAGRELVITNPDKIFFPQARYTKLDLAQYYAAVAEGALRGIAGRPIVLKRYVDGADAVRVAHEDVGTSAGGAQGAARHLDVIAREIELRVSRSRKEHLARIGDRDLVTVDDERLVVAASVGTGVSA